MSAACRPTVPPGPAVRSPTGGADVAGRAARARAAPAAARRRGRRPRPAGSAGRTSSPPAPATDPAANPGCRRAGSPRPAGRRSSPAVPRCTGGGRRASSASDGWSSTIRPPYITITRSVASSTMPRSWLIRIAVNCVLALQLLDRCHHRLLHDDVQRGGRLVEDDQPRLQRQRQRDRDPLPHAAGQLVRVPVEHLGVQAAPCSSSSAPRRRAAAVRRSSPAGHAPSGRRGSACRPCAPG